MRRADGPQTIYYRISVYEDATSDQADTPPPFPPSPVINEPFNTAVNAIVADVRDQSADTESFTSELLRRMNDPTFAEVSYQGVPDIRVVVYRGYPTMAMVRLPTRASDGKANLHKGAVGAGIDMSSGETLTGVLGNAVVDEHPDTGALITGLRIPHWDFILRSAARGYEVTGLGYLGVDMVIDRERGPLILEMNARPGLNIQIANCTGLAKRIARVDEIHDESAGPDERSRVARREFPANRQTSMPFDD